MYRPMPKLTAKDIKRFWAFVDKSGEHWLWTGCTVEGYGHFVVKGSMYRAHRIAYFIIYGVDPGQSLIRHGKTCPKNCVNPAHLKTGSHKDNAQDQIKHGTILKGEESPHTTLTDKQSQAILDSDKPYKELAAEYGVSISVVRKIKIGKTWKHLVGSPGYKPKHYTGVPGVRFNEASGRWVVQFQFNKVSYYLGLFDTEEEANKICLAKRKELGPKEPESLDSIKTRFEKKLNKMESDCWEWKHPDKRHGYGIFKYEGKSQLAHRVALKLYQGIDLGKDFACHGPTCSRSCVNPDHLEAKDAKGNSDDMERDGTRLRGENHPMAKLTDAERAEIGSSDEPTHVLVKRYGVSQGTIDGCKREWAKANGVRRIRTDNKSGITGVRWVNGKWVAQFRFKKKLYHLGLFDDKFEAELALIAKRAEVGAPAVRKLSAAA